MNGCFHQLRSRRALLALLVVPGFLLRAAVPPGFMPAMSPGTALTMAMCSGHSVQPVADPSDGGSVPGDPRQPSPKQQEPTCVFAAVAGAAPLPMVAAIAPTLPSPGHPFLPSIVTPVVKLATRAHPARAPPALV